MIAIRQRLLLLANFNLAMWAAGRGNEGSSATRLHVKIESKSTEGFLHLFRIRMLRAQPNQ